jgi:hypothetical protein
MLLSRDNVITLAQAAPLLRDQFLSELSRSGVIAVPAMAVSQISLNTDIHVTEIHLTMFDQNGEPTAAFRLPLHVAKPLAEHLPARIAEIENQERKRTKQ